MNTSILARVRVMSGFSTQAVEAAFWLRRSNRRRRQADAVGTWQEKLSSALPIGTPVETPRLEACHAIDRSGRVPICGSADAEYRNSSSLVTFYGDSRGQRGERRLADS